MEGNIFLKRKLLAFQQKPGLRKKTRQKTKKAESKDTRTKLSGPLPGYWYPIYKICPAPSIYLPSKKQHKKAEKSPFFYHILTAKLIQANSDGEETDF
jgi:hypothetical protein